MPCYAHSLAGQSVDQWQDLEEHLVATGDLATHFSAAYDSGWARVVGPWHDAGKYQRAFQDYIAKEKDPDAHIKGPDHSTVGALIAKEQKALPLAFAIAGHHGGLPDATSLRDRLTRRGALLDAARADGLPERLLCDPPCPPAWLRRGDPIQVSLWTRFLGCRPVSRRPAQSCP